jgi:hypothetical protein
MDRTQHFSWMVIKCQSTMGACLRAGEGIPKPSCSWCVPIILSFGLECPLTERTKEWSALSHCRHVPFTYLPCCSSKLTGCLIIRPLEDLHAPCQFDWHENLPPCNTLPVIHSLHTRVDICTVAHELGRQSWLCHVSGAVAEAGAPILAHDTMRTQTVHAHRDLHLCYAGTIAGRP